MKATFVRRSLSLLLTLTVIIGLFTVCFGASAADTRDLKLKTFYAAELAEAAEAVGTLNEHEVEIFTTYQDTIGRVSVNPGNYMLHSMNIPFQDMMVGDRPALKDGDTVRITVYLSADESYFDGDLAQIEWLLGGGSYDEQYQEDLIVDYNVYDSAETKIDEQYGYEYKAVSFDVLLSGEYWDTPINNNGNKDQAQLRIMGKNEAPVTVYYVLIENVDTEQTLLELDGVAIGGRMGEAGYWANVYPEGNQISGIASYMGLHPNRNKDIEPYCYNCDGFDHRGNAALLLDSLGLELAAGSYALGVKMKTQEAMGTTDKCQISIMAGDAELKKYVVTKQDVQDAGGSGGGYCTIRIPFTVSEANSGKKVTFKIELYNSNDFGLSQVSIYQEVDADAPVPAEAQAVIDAINSLDVANAEATAEVRADYDALSLIDKAWVGDELAEKLASYEKAQTDAVEVVNAINALGSATDVNDTNYTEKTEALTTAEALYAAYVKTNSQETADKLITNAAALTAYRTAYDQAEADAKEKAKGAAVQAVIEAIDAIGPIDEITVDNLEEKQALVDTASEAANDLVFEYGEDILSDVTNYAHIVEAQIKIDEITPIGPLPAPYTYGKVNNDDKIDAADALMALQHSVELVKLEDNAFLAADVNADEKVDATDALLILQYSVELIESFPAEQAAE